MRVFSAKRWPVLCALLAVCGVAFATVADDACREALDPTTASFTERVQSGVFNTGRGLGEYAEMLPPQFLDALDALGADAHWLDAGCGEGVATVQYLEGSAHLTAPLGYTDEALVKVSRLNKKPRFPRARVTGITYKFNLAQFSELYAGPRRPEFEQSGRGRWLTGRYFEDIPDAEIGQADLITDVFGVLAYAPRLDEVLRKYLRLLKREGVAYVFLGMRASSSLDDHLFVWRGGKKLSFVQWLQTVPGVSARQIDFHTGWGGVYGARGLELKRTSAAVAVPELELVEFRDGGPPYREYREKR